MIFNHCFKVRSLILTAVLFGGFGLVTHATAQERSFLVDLNSRTATDLGTLGGNRTVATAINDAGQVVGHSWTATGAAYAFITDPDGEGMTDLASLVSPPTGFTYFSDATAINNNGQVAAVVPEPAIYAMLLLGLGLVSFLARGRAAA